MITITPGKVLSPLKDDALVSEPHLILAANLLLNTVIAIPITVRRKKGRCYYSGYRTLEYREVQDALDLENPSLAQLPFTPRPVTTLTDDDLKRRFERAGRSEAAVALRQLAQRWTMIEPLVTGDSKPLLFDRECLTSLVSDRAQVLAEDGEYEKLFRGTPRLKDDEGALPPLETRIRRVREELFRLLNQFWAGGGVRSALIGFTENCGGKGKSKSAGTKKRGARNALTRQGEKGVEGLNITKGSEHAEIIKFCHDTYIVRGTTEAKALRRMWDDFYSAEVQQPDGSVKAEWLPAHQRPTRAHFRYWGTRESAAQAAWRRQLPAEGFDRNYRAIIGSATDDVYAIGQRGGIDSTPPDIQFVGALDRLARVGGGNRITLVDSLFGYIAGLYMGFDPPCAMTVRLAVFNAMDPDKAGWLEELGLLNIPPEDFIPIWFENLWADNTDLRCAEVMRCLDGIGTNPHFVARRRSDLNGVAEAGHHTLHRLVDHNMLGTTFGRSRNERGETSATERARQTMIQAIRETVRAIWTHNTMEIPVSRPLRMRLKNVPPTRLAMTREMIRLGKIARALHAIELARSHLLPRLAGTFTEKGVRLHMPDTGNKITFIDRVRYASTHPLFVQWCELARRGGKDDPDYFRSNFIVNPYRLRHIWYLDRDTGEQIELDAKSVDVRDPDLPYELTLPDIVDARGVESAERMRSEEQRQRKLGAMEREQNATKAEADAEYAAAVAKSGGEPSKAAAKRGKRENREVERQGTLYGIPVQAPGTVDTSAEVREPPQVPDAPNGATKPPKKQSPSSSAPASAGSSLLRSAVSRARSPGLR